MRVDARKSLKACLHPLFCRLLNSLKYDSSYPIFVLAAYHIAVRRNRARMTLENALLAAERLHVLFLMFGLILFASNAASTRQAEAIKAKKKTTVAGKSKRREAVKHRMVKGRKEPSKAKAKPEPLSIITDPVMAQAYRIGRDWPNFKNVSSIPL